MSKLHSIFLWIGVALYAFLAERSWLKHNNIQEQASMQKNVFFRVKGFTGSIP
jgi:hypothetical protein